jgi:carbamoyltransferase
MNVLGVNGAYHELAAAVVVDGRVVAAAEEERFNRRKHGAEARVDNPHELPAASIAQCLADAGLDAGDLDAVCYSFDPGLRRRDFAPDPYARPGDWGDPAGEATFLDGLRRVPETLSEVLARDVRGIVRWVPHHLAHAASAYYPSQFPSAAILVVDGIGEHATALLAHGQGRRIRSLSTVAYPHSLGFVWEKLSRFLGFGEYDAAKVMGLASYGDAARYQEQMLEVVAPRNGALRVSLDRVQFRRSDFGALEELFGPPAASVGRREEDLAAALQAITNEIMLSLARSLHAQTGETSLCVAGGLALNCTANWRVKEEGPFERMYVPSAPHDAGTAVGAALHHFWSDAPDAAPEHAEVPVMPTAYVGPAYGDDDAARAVGRFGLAARRSRDPEHEAARMLADGKVVAWFQDRMEFGPRALGNRSLLADPRHRETRELLNHKVKHREPFRPFAPSVLAERASGWFELGRPSASYASMSFAAPARADRLEDMPAVVHVDGTARLQTVAADANPRFHRLIAEFERLTGVPLVLNTSFNDSEPIVCTPEDALATFSGTEIDALVLGDLVVTR